MMINEELQEDLGKYFDSFLNRHQVELKTSMAASDDFIHLHYFNAHKKSLKEVERIQIRDR